MLGNPLPTNTNEENQNKISAEQENPIKTQWQTRYQSGKRAMRELRRIL